MVDLILKINSQSGITRLLASYRKPEQLLPLTKPKENYGIIRQ
jgi:hypothetical protein